MLRLSDDHHAPRTCYRDCDWWKRSRTEHEMDYQLSILLVPTLGVFAAVVWGLQHDQDTRTRLLQFGRPCAEVVMVVGLTIQIHETATFALLDKLGVTLWLLSFLAHVGVFLPYAFVDVTQEGLLVASCIFVLAIGAYAIRVVDWPYGLSPVVCVTLTASLLLVRLSDTL